MGPIRASLVTAIGVIFVAAGVFILVSGDPADASLGYGIIAFFGACVIIGLLQFAPREPAELDDNRALIIRPDKLHFAALAIGSLGMAVGSYFIAPLAAADGDPAVSSVAYFGVAFASLGVLVGVWRFFQRQPMARVDEAGVEVFGRNGWKLAWSEVRGIRKFEVAGQPFFYVDSDAKEHELSLSGTRLALRQFEALAIVLWRQGTR